MPNPFASHIGYLEPRLFSPIIRLTLCTFLRKGQGASDLPTPSLNPSQRSNTKIDIERVASGHYYCCHGSYAYGAVEVEMNIA